MSKLGFLARFFFTLYNVIGLGYLTIMLYAIQTNDVLFQFLVVVWCPVILGLIGIFGFLAALTHALSGELW